MNRGDNSKSNWDYGRSKPVPYGKPPHRSSNPLSGAELDEADRRRIAGDAPPPYAPPEVPDKPRRSGFKPRPKAEKKVVQSAGPRERMPLMIVLMFVLLGFLVVGITGLIVINRFFPDWPHHPAAPVEKVAAAAKPVRVASPAPQPPAKQATTPTGAVKLMLTASLAGDLRTAYAQWDVEPEDIITVERGVPITLAEQTEEAASIGSRAKPEQYTQRLLSQSGNEAKIGQYKDNVLTQVYSLRRVGQYWKLYNTASP